MDDISEFPTAIELSDLPEESGSIKIVWTYVNVNDANDTFTQEEHRSITFTKQ